MHQLKAGDSVRLTRDLTVGEGKPPLLKGAKGAMLCAHTATGYTVVFKGVNTPVADLTNADIELDEE